MSLLTKIKWYNGYSGKVYRGADASLFAYKRAALKGNGARDRGGI